jgi:hypothetical protein
MAYTGWTWDNADGSRVELVLTDKYVEHILDTGKEMGIITFQDYKEFIYQEWGRDKNIIKKELIEYMIKDGLVKWEYMRHDSTGELYSMLREVNSHISA